MDDSEEEETEEPKSFRLDYKIQIQENYNFSSEDNINKHHYVIVHLTVILRENCISTGEMSPTKDSAL